MEREDQLKLVNDLMTHIETNDIFHYKDGRFFVGQFLLDPDNLMHNQDKLQISNVKVNVIDFATCGKVRADLYSEILYQAMTVHLAKMALAMNLDAKGIIKKTMSRLIDDIGVVDDIRQMIGTSRIEEAPPETEKNKTVN